MDRANAAASTIQNAIGDSVDWTWVAAIGIRETGFRNLSETGGGAGLGYFQLTNQPGVTATLAGDLAWASNFVASYLVTAMGSIGSASGLSGDELATATFASYNRGVPGVINDLSKGLNPDARTTGHNYGSNIFNLTKCF